MTMLQTLRIELESRVPAGVTAKDIVLHLLVLPDIRSGSGVGKVSNLPVPPWPASRPTSAPR